MSGINWRAAAAARVQPASVHPARCMALPVYLPSESRAG